MRGKVRRKTLFPYVWLGLALLVWTNISRASSDALRTYSVAALSPLWQMGSVREDGIDELAHLRLENQTLKSQIQWLQDLVLQAQRIPMLDSAYKKAMTESVRVLLNNLLQQQISAMPAQVIYRDPSCWGGTLWINVGEAENEAFGSPLVARNSPVLCKGALIGVIDHVGHRQSRVRLLTDPGLSPAVRVARGNAFNGEILYAIDLLERVVKGKKTLSAHASWLQQLRKDVETEGCEAMLAKGELHGSGATLWYSKAPLLKGTGFNYDRTDREGVARDLRTGHPLHAKGELIPLIQPGDLLVTSGLDGIFPPGLSVATVTEVFPIKEGGLFYDIEASPAAGSLADLNAVFVLPALTGE